MVRNLPHKRGMMSAELRDVMTLVGMGGAGVMGLLTCSGPLSYIYGSRRTSMRPSLIYTVPYIQYMNCTLM